MTDDTLPAFGEPLDADELSEFATIDSADIDAAIDWFDEHASVLFFGALEAGNT